MASFFGPSDETFFLFICSNFHFQKQLNRDNKKGATTISIMTFSIMTFGIPALNTGILIAILLNVIYTKCDLCCPFVPFYFPLCLSISISLFLFLYRCLYLFVFLSPCSFSDEKSLLFLPFSLFVHLSFSLSLSLSLISAVLQPI